ncbi:MAG: hypothetical protein E3K40_15680 [Candidatus Brocadia sp.]|nr:fibronectin type III domain-containing protein [Candidatus Brocadia sp.]MDG6028106.1 hypothetical protein [Candidatus Brocadia sp.]
MSNISVSIAYCFLIACGIFSLCSRLTCAEEIPLVTGTPLTTPTPPSVITGEATNVTSSSVTLNGTTYLLISTKFFEYGTITGTYDSAVYDVRGTITDKKEDISANISGLLAATTYYYRLVVYEKPPGGYTYGNEKSFITLKATPIPTATPTPVCEAESIEASPKILKLKREALRNVTVTVTGIDSCSVVSEMVTAKIKFGKKRISVTPLSQNTDAGGEAIFTIKATKETGNAKVKFETPSGLKTAVTVKVKR